MDSLPGPRHHSLLFAKAFPPTQGGVELYSLELAQSLKHTGARPIVITAFRGKLGMQRHHNLPVFNVGESTQLRVFVRMLVAAYRITRRRQISFSYATTWRVALPILMLRTSSSRGVTIHGREVLVPRGPVRLLMKYVLSQIESVFSVSQYTLDQTRLAGVLPKDVGKRNWNGISSFPASLGSANSEAPSRPLQIFTICRLVPRKNLVKAVQAVARMKSTMGEKPVNYVIAGGGEQESELRSFVEKEGLSEFVQIRGRVTEEEKRKLYEQADIFLHPQVALNNGMDVEGFGLVVAEAMARGIAVIAGIDGGPAELIQDGKTGRLVDGNSVEAIARALCDLACDFNLRRTMGAYGRAWTTEHLSWRAHAMTILNDCIPEFAATKMQSFRGADAEY